MSDAGIIYCAENNVNGGIYIGQTVRTLEKRKSIHAISKDDSYFHRALNKCDDWDWTILQSYEASKGKLNIILNKAEKHFIKIFDSFNNGYNMTEGGHGSCGYQHRDTAKAKIGRASIGNDYAKNSVRGEDFRAHVSKQFKGKRLSKAHRQKLSTANTGKIISREIKNKISITLTGRCLTDEHKKKIRLVQKGVKKDIVTCPYCGKYGGKPAMARWHYKNCKAFIGVQQ